MKRLLMIVVCLLSCTFFSAKVIAQVDSEQLVQTVNSGDNEKIQALIVRTRGERSAAGYSIMTYREFQSKRPLSADLMTRFHQNLLRYANKEYGGENTSFVIYKGSCYELQVIEDCAGQCFPNKYYMADTACE